MPMIAGVFNNPVDLDAALGEMYAGGVIEEDVTVLRPELPHDIPDAVQARVQAALPNIEMATGELGNLRLGSEESETYEKLVAEGAIVAVIYCDPTQEKLVKNAIQQRTGRVHDLGY